MIRKCPIWPKQKFFPKSNKILIYLVVYCIIKNFQNILRVDPLLWECITCGVKIAQWVVGPNRKMFRKSSIIIFNLPITVFFFFFLDLPIAKYERKLLDPVSRNLKTCKIHFPQTNQQTDENLGKERLFENFIYLFYFCRLVLYHQIKFKLKFKWISK